MLKLLSIIILLNLANNVSVSFADYVQLGPLSYPVSSNSCPNGRLCDYVSAQANKALSLIASCNKTLIDLSNSSMNNNTINNQTNQTNQINQINQIKNDFINECLQNLTDIYDSMMNIYVVNSTNNNI